jgi:ATP-dependent Clp protease ATP-binding subunit ClpC
LTERVRRRPYSVVLFDEVDKAHPDVMHMMLQILEEGRLTDSLGRQVDFRNTVVILTSNLGFDFNRRGRGLGFASDEAQQDYVRLKNQLMNEARLAFKPELLNRFDDIIVFKQLERTDIEQIVALEIGQVTARLKSRGIAVSLEPDALDFLIDKGYAPELGARPLRRAIEQHLEDPLAEALLHGAIADNHELLVTVDGDKLAFRSVTPPAGEEAAVVREEAPTAPPAEAEVAPDPAPPAPKRRTRARKSE